MKDRPRQALGTYKVGLSDPGLSDVGLSDGRSFRGRPFQRKNGSCNVPYKSFVGGPSDVKKRNLQRIQIIVLAALSTYLNYMAYFDVILSHIE